MAKYRKKTLTDAMQYNGSNYDEIVAWAQSLGADVDCLTLSPTNTIIIHTLEGDMEGLPLDWIMCGAAKELYPCKPDIFEATYEKVDV